MENKVKYPIGDQDFKSIRVNDCLYIDKTRYIEKLLNAGSKYYFLARPRRFGKSLFLSTLRYFFEGERELFKGLYIDSTDWKWKEYPVLHLDLNQERYAEAGKLEFVLDFIFQDWEKKYEVDNVSGNFAQRFANIIKTAHEKTGKEVIILVDEYDKPLVTNLNKGENFEHYRSQLASLYSNFKSSAAHIKLVFLTGVSRFSRLSVFSDLNNLRDITFLDEYADICGITTHELMEYFQEGIQKFAKKSGLSIEEALSRLKNNYDGYRFAATGSDIYNPWSLLNAMEDSHIGNYWNETGLPTIIAESLKRLDVNLEEFFDIICPEEELKGFDLLNPNPTVLLYQTGYLTIKDYDYESGNYQLGIPNNEVKRGLFDVLVPYYVRDYRLPANQLVNEVYSNFIFGRPEKSMKALQAYFAGIDYSMKIENENNFHNAFFLLTDLMGLKTQTEVHTSQGRIDMEIKTSKYIYIIELKYDHSPEEALRQIEEKNYARKYQTDHRKIFLIGAEFSSETRCIEGWIIKDYE